MVDPDFRGGQERGLGKKEGEEIHRNPPTG